MTYYSKAVRDNFKILIFSCKFKRQVKLYSTLKRIEKLI